ncbi:MAG TPA: hypothetical protein PLT06_10945 [Syntrophorhabdaceae bacterium]|nr:hypothetical protein [Syntrophorhabdaceae bacterium]
MRQRIGKDRWLEDWKVRWLAKNLKGRRREKAEGWRAGWLEG